MFEGFPYKGRGFERFRTAVLGVPQKTQYGLSQGGETRTNAPAKRAAVNADLQKVNPVGARFGGYEEQSSPAFDNSDFGGGFGIKEERSRKG